MRLAVFGAGGFSREVYDLVLSCGHTVVGFVDDVVGPTHSPSGLPVHRSVDGMDVNGVVIAVGDTVQRERLATLIEARTSLVTLIHPSACVSPSAQIGKGSLVMQNVVVNAQAVVGQSVILNVGCCVAHDCSVGDFCHIAPAVQLAGGSTVGARTFCGTASVILPGVAVGAGCMLGAGAVVNRNVSDGLTVVGVPARPRGKVRVHP